MKKIDYAPRSAPFDSHLTGRDLVGVEVGVDVGAHAEALLTCCPVAMLYLVDPWPNQFAHGYCVGRLTRFRTRIKFVKMNSLEGVDTFQPSSVDFVYLDQVRDEKTAVADLEAWWPLVKPGGILGYRNYHKARGDPSDRAIERFVARHEIRSEEELYLNEIILFKTP